MADNLDVIYRILTDLSGLKTGVQEVTKHTDQIDKQMTQMLGSVKKIGAALGISFGAASIIAFGKSILDDADALTRLSDKTGIGTEALQRLRAVAEDSGNSLDQVTTAITQMQKRLAGDDKSAVKALEQLHLSLGALMALGPDQQFITIAKAIATIPDPAERARLAMVLFGKAGAEILPTLRADIEKLSKGVTVMSTEATARLDAFGDAWGRLGRTIKGWSGEAMAGLLHFSEDYITGFIDPTAAATQRLIDKQNELANSMPKAPGGPGGLTAPPIGMPSVPSAGDQEALKQAAENHLKAAIASDKHADAVKKIDAAYRQVTNEIAVLNMEMEGRQLKQAAEDAEMFAGMLKTGGSQLPLFSRQIGELFAPLQKISPTLAKAKSGFLDFIKGGASDLFGGAKNVSQGMHNVVGSIGTGLFEGIGGVLSGGIMTAINFGMKALGAGISKLLKTEEKQVNDMRDKFQEMNFGSLPAMDEAFRKVGMRVEQVLNVKKVKDFQAAVDEFNRRLNLQKQAYDDLNAAIERYHFKTEELGPALAKQKLTEQLEQIYKDWMLLNGAQIDAGVVAERMSDAVNELLRQYLVLGMEVPLELKPILQKLIDMGLLLDANGDHITDITQIPFAESMTAGFDKVVAAIKEMTDALKYFLGIVNDTADQVRNFPQFPDVQVPGVPGPGGGPDVPQPPDTQSGLSVSPGSSRVTSSHGGSDPALGAFLRFQLPDLIQRSVAAGMVLASA